MDATDIASGTASLMSAVQNLRRRANDTSSGDGASAVPTGADDANKRPVDIVRKLDLLQKLSDAANGNSASDGGTGGGEELSLQDRVFHSMVLEKLPDFSKLGPSPLARGLAGSGKPGAAGAPGTAEPQQRGAAAAST
eukprot:CAMPEP_0174845474 /NCGR_PEP_ID=MMETSP1114-20130205/11752_1 /TAXON_ID=312471 /ORGANISM="Neobodo designis, Strain CCAP 1951/1" /LENGTH=137 /DNA_ID=CAMNT_0016079721 /DNA_START=59 /DNA_END=468 /DNA_ORIENTATION=+